MYKMYKNKRNDIGVTNKYLLKMFTSPLIDKDYIFVNDVKENKEEEKKYVL